MDITLLSSAPAALTLATMAASRAAHMSFRASLAPNLANASAHAPPMSPPAANVEKGEYYVSLKCMQNVHLTTN